MNWVDMAATETRDLSPHGLRFDLSQAIRSGSSIEILMTVPHQLTQAGPVRIRCLGRVIRNDLEATDKMGVIAVIE